MRYWFNKALDLVLRRKPILVVDIDSTLYPFLPMFVVAAREALGIEVSPEPRSFEEPHDGLTPEQKGAIYRLVNTQAFIDTHHTPFDGAKAVLDDLSERFEIRYVTDRPHYTFAMTNVWLKSHGFPQAHRLYTCEGNKKPDVCRLRGRIWGIIDDKPSTMVWSHYEAKIPHVLAIRNSTNCNLEDLPFVHLADTWFELEQELLKRLS